MTMPDWYTQALQSWHQTVEKQQRDTLAFQQAVASITTARAKMLTHWWQQAPQQWQALMQGAPANFAEQWARWYGQTMEQALILAADTTAHRANLWQVWQQQVPTMAATPVPQATARTASPSPRQTESHPPQQSAAKTQEPSTQPQESNVVPLTTSTKDSFARSATSSGVVGARRAVAGRARHGNR
ncbi:MAG: hypothetical protein H6922_00440 [Pseudomonadaceae bacterium]|nr:hypothetical protein [Pseudomonadaceae bacterium]